MKLFAIIALSGSIFLLSAQTIAEQIEEIHKSSGEKRVELVNKLKTQIAELNQAQRQEAIESLKENKVKNPIDRDGYKMQKNMSKMKSQENSNSQSQHRGVR